MTAPDAKAVEAAIQQVKVTSDIVRAVPAVDAWLKHLKVVVDAAQAYLDAQKAEPVAWMYTHDGMLDSAGHPIISKTQLGLTFEPWTETPLCAHPSPKDPT